MSQGKWQFESDHRVGQQDWQDWSAPELSGPPPLYKTLSETFRAHNHLSNHPSNHLFLGLNPDTGAPEMMDMDKPRSLLIDDNHYSGPTMLRTMATAIKWRANQHRLPITVISHDHSGWFELSKQHHDVSLLSPHMCSTELRLLPYNDRRSPHFLIIDNLVDLLKIDNYDKSILGFLIASGAQSSGIYVLASHGYINNIKANNELGHWLDHGNLLLAETSGVNTLTLGDGAKIWVPNPQ